MQLLVVVVTFSLHSFVPVSYCVEKDASVTAPIPAETSPYTVILAVFPLCTIIASTAKKLGSVPDPSSLVSKSVTVIKYLAALNFIASHVSSTVVVGVDTKIELVSTPKSSTCKGTDGDVLPTEIYPDALLKSPDPNAISVPL